MLAILAAGYRSCQETVSGAFTTGLSPRLPESGKPGRVGIASFHLSQAPPHVRRVVEHLRNVRHWQPLRGFKGGPIGGVL